MNRDNLLNLVEKIILKAKWFPIDLSQISKEVAKKINTQKINRISSTIDILLQTNDIVIFNDNGEYFHKQNIIAIKDKIILLIEKYHNKYPHKKGITNSELKKLLSSNKKKKKKRVISPDLFQSILQNLTSENLIFYNLNFICLNGFVQNGIDEKQQKIDDFIFNYIKKKKFTRILISNIVQEQNTNIKTVLYSLKILNKNNLIIKINDSIYADVDSLIFLKKKIFDFIKSNSSIHVKEIAELANTSRRTISPVADYLDQIKFTKRVEDKRILY
ncbi:MAG: SelB C-terminal domain-containing protein [Candidatus Cloacimonetes bacterium]|nr:SelB C-terminal domain-containing protein [Candidatus Cloacimonadota bacterium]